MPTQSGAPRAGVLLLVGAMLALLGTSGSGATAAVQVLGFNDQPAGTRILEEYRSSAGLYFRNEDPGYPPVIVSAPQQARSGAQVADISQCNDSGKECEFPTSETVGHFTTTVRSVTVYAGYLGAHSSATAQLRLSALNTNDNVIAQSGPVTVTQCAPFTTKITVTSPSLLPDIAAFHLVADGSEHVRFDDLTVERPGVPSPADFSLSVNSDVVTVRQGTSSDPIPMAVERLNGSNGNITLSASNLPNGMSASFSPNPVPATNNSATLTLTATDRAPVSSNFTQATITGTPGPGAGSAPRSTTKYVRVGSNCDPVVKLDYVDARADCWRKNGDTYTATDQDVRLNGLLLAPTSGVARRITIDTARKRVTSDGLYAFAVPGNPDLPLYAKSLNWDLSRASGTYKVVDASVENKEFKGLPLAKATISLTKKGSAVIKPTLKLGFWPFNYIGSLTASTEFTTNNNDGADFSGLELRVGEVPVPGLELKDVFLKWKSAQTWAGGAKLTLEFQHSYQLEAAFGLKDGAFDYLRGGVGGLNISIGPGVFLQRISPEVHRTPLSIRGEVGLSGGPQVAGHTAVSFDGGFTATIADPFVVRADGKLKLGGRFDLAEAFVSYSSDGLFELGGTGTLDLGRGYLNGTISGWVWRTEAFNLEGSIRGCIRIWGPDPCAGASAVLSSTGVVACIHIVIISGGIGYRWGDGVDIFGGCDLGPWRATRPASAAAGGVRRVPLPPGLPSVAFALQGAGGLPVSATLTGPNGERIVVSPTHPVTSGRLSGALDESGNAYLMVRRPAAGTWTIMLADGSAPLASLRTALGLPQPSVQVRVTGRGHTRALHWRLRAIAGQRVTLAEAGRGVHRAIATVSASRGTLRFQPVAGPGGRRQILALVEQNGRPRRNLIAGSYVAPARARPAKPTHVQIIRRGTSLRIAWKAPQQGFRHAVYVTLSDNRRLLLLVAPRRRSVTIRSVTRRTAATAEIVGLTHVNGRGPAAKVRIKGGRNRST